VTAEGYRANGGAPAPWPPPADAVFLFGGSTAFGYGLSDRETLAAALERRLAGAGCGPRPVYNFARSNYFSTQERILFEQLLAAGRRPAAAVFFDGLNDALYPRDEPKFTARLRYLMDESDGALWWRAATRLPLVRLVRRLAPAPPDDGYGGPPDPELAERILDRWARNRGLIEAVAAREGVAALFVWQPVPAYGWDLAHHPLAGEGVPAAELLALVYERMEERRGAAGADASFLWLADLQAGRTDPLYVDRVHYGAAFTDEIAGRVAGALAPLLCPTEGEPAGGEDPDSAGSLTAGGGPAPAPAAADGARPGTAGSSR
jgi:hypothetical protein